MLAPEVETRPWAEQSVIDDAQYRNQLEYLQAHSVFYQRKFKAVGIDRAGAGGLADIANLPFTEKSEIRASWEPALSNFKKIRKKYLLYKDFAP